MTILNKYWIKPGLYPVNLAHKLKIENTQEFHDRLVGLRGSTGGSGGVVHSRKLMLHHDLLNLWQSDGQQPPKFTDKVISNWSDEDFLKFAIQVSRYADNHEQNYQKELSKRLGNLLLRDQTLFQEIAIKRIQNQLECDPISAVNNQANINELMADSKKDDVIVDQGFEQLHGVERIREISRLSKKKVNQILVRQLNIRRLERVDPMKESFNLLNNEQPEKQKNPPKKTDRSGGLEL